jgi:hypothetical protein
MLIEFQPIAMTSESILKVLSAVMSTPLPKLDLMIFKLRIKMKIYTLSKEKLKAWDPLTVVWETIWMPYWQKRMLLKDILVSYLDKMTILQENSRDSLTQMKSWDNNLIEEQKYFLFKMLTLRISVSLPTRFMTHVADLQQRDMQD